MITVLLKFLLAHILGDFVFQPDSWVKDKEEKKQRSLYLYFHAALHFVLLLLLLQGDFYFWKALLFITLSHFLIDLAKLHFQNEKNKRLMFIVDQAAHIAIIVAAVNIYEPLSLSLQWFYGPQTLLFLLALLTVTFVSAIVVKNLISGWQFVENNKEESLKNAGKYIGMLERLFVFGFIILNQWGSIGLLIAAKSIFRFSDLSRAKDRKLTEYILIGTLLSFGLAMVTGLLYKYVSIIINS